jgi:archaellum biogenesis ATPase FlaH
MAWADGLHDKCIFWLNGMAGTGKSTISRTVAQMFQENKRLGASFSFSAVQGDLMPTAKFFGTLAFQLAKVSADLRTKICHAVANNDHIGQQQMQDQWTKLIFQPLSDLKPESRSIPLVIVIDALDECKDENGIIHILDLLKGAKDLSNVRLRILITSRPEGHICNGFGDTTVYDHLDLHKVPSDTIMHDMSVFFESKLQEIKTQKPGLPADWPSKDQIKSLIQRAGGFFIYAATVCRFIGAKHASPTERLDRILNGQPSQKATQELDDMYSKILEYDLGELDDDEITTFFKNFRDVVGSVMLLFDSLSANALSKICDMKIEDVCNILNSLRSVLDIPKSLDSESLGYPIRLFHLSFREFLLDEKRCPNHQLRINKQKKHNDLFVACLTLMSTHLKQDICNLRLPGALASGVETSKVEECLPPSVQYACRYWVHHLEQSEAHLGDNIQVYDFLQKYFLHWLEALALMRRISDGAVMLSAFESIFTVSD